MKKINIGLIGVGMIGDVHAEKIKKDGRAEITWIADKSIEALKLKMEKLNIANGTTDFNDILADKNIDAVIIAAPPFTHHSILLEAMKNGKHVLVEKPLCVNVKELNDIMKEYKKYNNLVVMDCSSRHSRLQPKFKFIKKMIGENKIGDIYHIHHNHLMSRTFLEYNKNASWALSRKLSGGGPLIDWGVYDLAFHLGLLDEGAVLKKFISFKKNGLKKHKNKKSDVEEHAGAFMEFDKGISYYYERGAGVNAEVENESRIFGTTGSLRFSYCSWEKEEIEHCYTDKSGNYKKRILKADSNGFDDHFGLTSHFLDCILKNKKPVLDLEASGRIIKMLFDLLE